MLPTRHYLPHTLLAIYLLETICLGITPFSRDVWWAENLPIFAIVTSIVILYSRGVRFSSTAYLLMFVFPFLHTIGGHYTFERVPFDWFNQLFNFHRNMFDRMAHFSVGFYAYPLAEHLITRKKVATPFWAYAMGLTFIMSIAATYEIIEWVYAVKEGGEAGTAFLGSQGDIWDAQKDMLMDTLGAVFALFLFTLRPAHKTK